MTETADTRDSLQLFDLDDGLESKLIVNAHGVALGLRDLLAKRIAGASDVSEPWEGDGGDSGDWNIGFTYQGQRYNMEITKL
jgi:hypothetical protein